MLAAIDPTAGAIVGGVALVLAASIPAFLNRRTFTTHIGKKNGHGTIAEIVDGVKANQELHDIKDEVRFKAVMEKLGIEDPWPAIARNLERFK